MASMFVNLAVTDLERAKAFYTAVGGTVAAGIAAGGTETQAPADYGFMYQRQLTDPDGNILEFG